MLPLWVASNSNVRTYKCTCTFPRQARKSIADAQLAKNEAMKMAEHSTKSIQMLAQYKKKQKSKLMEAEQRARDSIVSQLPKEGHDHVKETERIRQQLAEREAKIHEKENMVKQLKAQLHQQQIQQEQSSEHAEKLPAEAQDLRRKNSEIRQHNEKDKRGIDESALTLQERLAYLNNHMVQWVSNQLDPRDDFYKWDLKNPTSQDSQSLVDPELEAHLHEMGVAFGQRLKAVYDKEQELKRKEDELQTAQGKHAADSAELNQRRQSLHGKLDTLGPAAIASLEVRTITFDVVLCR